MIDRSKLGVWIAATGLAGAIVLMPPHRMVDADALSHLSTGRWIVENGRVPHTDPFTFAHPSHRWSNPEWLGDVIWYGLHATTGEAGTQVFKLLIILFGVLLAFRRGVLRGAPPVVLFALMIVLLPACVGRFTMRNHIHALWLIPLFQTIAERAWRRRALWLTLLPLGWLWGNLHSSFVIGWGVVIATVLDRRSEGEPVDWKAPGGVLAALVVAPTLGPQGLSAYTQLWDHLVGAEVYRRFIAEWQSPLASPALLAVVPLHIVAAAGLLGLGWKRNRRPPGTVLLLLLGLAAAYVSRRFIPLVLVLSAPRVALGLSRMARPRRPMLLAGVTALVAVVYVGLAAWVLMRAAPPPLDQRAGTARRAAVFLAQHAPEGSRVFNSFNAGPWLLWHAPSVKHYIDPRNNHASAFLDRYVRLLRRPDDLVRMMGRLDVDLALLGLADRRANGVVGVLDAAPGWRLVFLDGHHALYARDGGSTRALARRFGYTVVRARRAVDPGALAAHDMTRDLTRLREQGPVLAAGHEACLRALDRSNEKTLDALRAVQAAAGRLPPSGTLAACVATGLARAGHAAAAAEVLRQARAIFPDDPFFRSAR